MATAATSSRGVNPFFLIIVIICFAVFLLVRKSKRKAKQTTSHGNFEQCGPFSNQPEIYIVKGSFNTLKVYDDKVQIRDNFTGDTTTLLYDRIYAATTAYDYDAAASYIKFDDGRPNDSSKKQAYQPNCFAYSGNKSVSVEKITEIVDFVNKKIDSKSNTSAKVSVSAPDEIKKYKELLDDGIITVEEFEAKKKQLLGL